MMQHKLFKVAKTVGSVQKKFPFAHKRFFPELAFCIVTYLSIKDSDIKKSLLLKTVSVIICTVHL